MYIFSRISKKRELRENMYSAKISTFTVAGRDPTRGYCERRYLHVYGFSQVTKVGNFV